jgi:hypothetical protein
MKLEDIRPADCYARAQRLLGEVVLVRTEMGRGEDARPALEITNAQPRECYFEAIATWNKVERLASEVGVPCPRFAWGVANLRELRAGHVLRVIDAVLSVVEAVKQRFIIGEIASEPDVEPKRQPSDVLGTLVRINREMSRTLERPFTPGDVYRVVALASAYASRLGGDAPLAGCERKRKPVDCYQRLAACHTRLGELIAKRGDSALTARGTPPEVLPGDVYDLASLVLGEAAFLHALTPNAQPLHAIEPVASGHRLPAHVDQLARTLEAQLAALA